METADKKTMEYLKQLIQQQIEKQEETNNLFKELLKNNRKVIRRITLVFFAVAAMLLGGIIFIIYTENKPQSVLNTTLKAAKDLETRISLQREYIDMNTKEIHDLKDSSK